MPYRFELFIERTFDVVSQSGAEFNARCMWHHDVGKPNLYINAEKGMYLCHSCGTKGSLERLGATLAPRSTQDVRKRLAARQQPTQPQQTYPEAWLRQFDAPTDYWTEERGLSQATVDLFRLGYDPFADRVTIPLRDVRGRVLGVTRRITHGDARPKYMDPKGYPKGRHLYGAWLLEEERTVALVEGLVDVHRCWEERVPALGLMGARLTPDQRKVLLRLGIKKVVLMLDNDQAGINGTVGVYEALKGSGIQVLSGWYRDYWLTPTEDGLRSVKDPDALSGDRLRKMWHSAVDLREWAARVS